MTQVVSYVMKEALSCMINEVPNHVGVVEFANQMLFMILGRIRFYFVERTLRHHHHSSQIIESIEYSKIELIETDS